MSSESSSRSTVPRRIAIPRCSSLAERCCVAIDLWVVIEVDDGRRVNRLVDCSHHGIAKSSEFITCGPPRAEGYQRQVAVDGLPMSPVSSLSD